MLKSAAKFEAMAANRCVSSEVVAMRTAQNCRQRELSPCSNAEKLSPPLQRSNPSPVPTKLILLPLQWCYSYHITTEISPLALQCIGASLTPTKRYHPCANEAIPTPTKQSPNAPSKPFLHQPSHAMLPHPNQAFPSPHQPCKPSHTQAKPFHHHPNQAIHPKQAVPPLPQPSHIPTKPFLHPKHPTSRPSHSSTSPIKQSFPLPVW